jgi:hypothetical protein
MRAACERASHQRICCILRFIFHSMLHLVLCMCLTFIFICAFARKNKRARKRRCRYGWTALHKAAQNNRAEVNKLT